MRFRTATSITPWCNNNCTIFNKEQNTSRQKATTNA